MCYPLLLGMLVAVASLSAASEMPASSTIVAPATRLIEPCCYSTVRFVSLEPLARHGRRRRRPMTRAQHNRAQFDYLSFEHCPFR